MCPNCGGLTSVEPRELHARAGGVGGAGDFILETVVFGTVDGVFRKG